MENSYERDLNLYKKLRKTLIILAILSPLIILTIFILAGVIYESFAGLHVSYICHGVEETWLVNHPFVTDDLPTTIKTNSSYTIVAPTIEGYKFSGWSIANDSKVYTDECLPTNALSSASSYAYDVLWPYNKTFEIHVYYQPIGE